MSDIHGPLHGLGSAIIDPIEQYRRLLTQQQKALVHVSLASHALGWCVYLCPLFKTGPYLAAVMIGAAAFGNGHAPDMWMPRAAWAGLAFIALVWLFAGWKGAEGPRDFGAALWRLLLTGIFAALLWYRVYPDWGALVEFVLKGFYIAWLASHVARFLIAAQLFGVGSALRAIKRQLKQRNAPLIPARPRRRFFFWW
jgi:hypothetical protein